jgi:hypothetical protein
VPPEYVRICPVCEQENPPERVRCTCGASLAGVDSAVTGRPAPAAEPVAEAAAPSSDAIICPYPDCAQPNPPGGERCVYCDRPLAAPPPISLPGARPLPAALAARYRTIDVFPATGSEADILLVVGARGDKAVVKLYRKGIVPDFKLLDVLAQTVGGTVVHVVDHGVSDGTAFEVLEYVPGGTLQDLMRAGPLPRADIRRVIEDVADALNGIHAHNILHRDLKPENVLVRTTSPLSLALTDFGIASMSAATQHFTTAARTTKYAAPEVLTGVLDAKADWWSLGMIVLEAASGRHPFDGLTEQVMNHQLATRPIDVRGVYDDALRLLCRGLLLRDPKKRFGKEEVGRWLAGDASLAVPEGADGVASTVRPYRIGKMEAATGSELAVALAKNWDAARRDLQRGQIARWIEQELHDYNLLRALRDAQEQKGSSDDGRLLRLLLAASPDLPPVWQGAPVTPDTVTATARSAASGDESARDWLDSLVRDDVLTTFADAGDKPLRDLARHWRDAWDAFTARWQEARSAEESWRQAPRDVGGGTHAVSYDDLAYGPLHRLELPPRRTVDGALLVALADTAYVDALRGEVVAGLGQAAGYCPWFETAWEKYQSDAIGVVVAHTLLPHALDAAASERRRQKATAEGRARLREEACAGLRERVSEVLELVPAGDEDLPAERVAQLLGAFNGLQIGCQRVERLSGGDAGTLDLQRTAGKLAFLAIGAQRALAQAEEAHGVNTIFMAPGRLAIGVVVIAGALLLRMPVAILVVLGAAVLVVGYRWYVGFRATEDSLDKLRAFGLAGRTFLRATDPREEQAT